MATLAYDTAHWERFPGIVPEDITPEARIHLVVSLILYLGISLVDILEFIFTSRIRQVRERAGRFVGVYRAGATPKTRFPAGYIYKLWHDQFHKSRPYLHAAIEPCMHEIALRESDNIISDKRLKIRINELTNDSFEKLLQPGAVMDIYKECAPYTVRFLDVFASSPNPHRKREANRKAKERKKARKKAKAQESAAASEEEGYDEDWNDDPNLEDDDPAAFKCEGDPSLEGFSRNPAFAVMLAISMLTFVRNRATNLLPLLCGLFFKIEGTSSRVMKMLSNTGLSISARTIERLKEKVTEEAIRSAGDLVKSGRMFAVVFDNINLYLRKYDQRLTNQHSMIHATNTAIIAINSMNFDAQAAINVDENVGKRGSRAKAALRDVLPDASDDQHIRKSSKVMVADMITRYAPESKNWPNRNKMLDENMRGMPEDRPLDAEKSDTRPLGVFDVNEGSKDGVVKLLELIPGRLGLSESDWSASTRILLGDWLSVNNFRLARADRSDEEDNEDSLIYGEIVSQTFHFALNASQLLIRTHHGLATDPTSLAAHKTLLRRVWDVNKANYAAAKSLIRHSFIARVLHLTMKKLGFKRWADLASWIPENLDKVQEIAAWIVDEYATTNAAKKAKLKGDDWAAHDAYFLRDALIFMEFEQAVSFADAGRVLRVMKYWCLAFRGAGQHNYGRECAEIILQWKYELTEDLQRALERSWFVNTHGIRGMWIAADLYLEHMNLSVKRVYLAQGNGVTIRYIMQKGSACVEVFRSVSRLVARFFGDPDRARKSKEVAFQEDMRALVEYLEGQGVHGGYKEHFVPAPKKKKKEKTVRSAVIDTIAVGAGVWQSTGKWNEFLRTTTYDAALGYPVEEPTSDQHDSTLDNGTVFDDPEGNLLGYGGKDLEGDGISSGLGGSSIGGGGEFDTGEDEV